MIHKDRNNRRYISDVKRDRKKRIVHQLNDYWFYKHDGMYRKGKIHCSCPLCAAKTNSKLNKSKGKVDGNRRLCRLAVTNERYGKKNYTRSDKRKVDRMRSAYDEWSKTG